MRKIAFAIAALGSVMLVDVASAAPIVSDTTPAAHTIVEKVYYRRWRRGWYGPRYRRYYRGPRYYGYGYRYGYRGGCYRWRRICAGRWGWGGPRFRRCLWRHAC